MNGNSTERVCDHESLDEIFFLDPMWLWMAVRFC